MDIFSSLQFTQRNQFGVIGFEDLGV